MIQAAVVLICQWMDPMDEASYCYLVLRLKPLDTHVVSQA